MTCTLEKLEATIASYDQQKVMVRLPLTGQVQLAFYGTLHFQMNTGDEPQFLIFRDGNPGVSLVFQVYDVDCIHEPDNISNRQIILKKSVDNISKVE